MIYGFTYRGRHCSEFGVNLLKYVVHSPELREYEDEVDGLPGTIDYGTDWGKRPIDMIIDIVPTDVPFKLQQSRILNWLKPTLPAGILVFDELPDRFYFAKFTGKLGIMQIMKYGEFEFTFKCTDPFAYGPERLREETITESPSVIKLDSLGSEPTPTVIKLTNTGLTNITSITIQNEYEVEE